MPVSIKTVKRLETILTESPKSMQQILDLTELSNKTIHECFHILIKEGTLRKFKNDAENRMYYSCSQATARFQESLEREATPYIIFKYLQQDLSIMNVQDGLARPQARLKNIPFKLSYALSYLLAHTWSLAKPSLFSQYNESKGLPVGYSNLTLPLSEVRDTVLEALNFYDDFAKLLKKIYLSESIWEEESISKLFKGLGLELPDGSGVLTSEEQLTALFARATSFINLVNSESNSEANTANTDSLNIEDEEELD